MWQRYQHNGRGENGELGLLHIQSTGSTGAGPARATHNFPVEHGDSGQWEAPANRKRGMQDSFTPSDESQRRRALAGWGCCWNDRCRPSCLDDALVALVILGTHYC